ncbi:hypothetical protein ABDC18_002874 [Escherichia coli]
MATYNATSAISANTTAYSQRLGNKPTFGAPSENYSVPNYPSVAGMNKRPFNSVYGAPPTRAVSGNLGGDVRGWQPEGTEYQPTKNPGKAYEFVQSASDSMKLGDGGVHDQSVDLAKNKLQEHIQRYATSENPQAVKEEIESDPWYSNSSMWKGIFNAAVATMDGANASQALEAGQRGLREGEAEDTRDSLRENAVKNKSELLQYYTPDSVQAYTLTGDQSVLRERTLTPEQKRQQAEADKQDARDYEQQIYERNRNDTLADREAAAKAAKAPKYSANKYGVLNENTGEISPYANSSGVVGENGIPTSAKRVTLSDGSSAFVDLSQKPIKSGSNNSWIAYDEKGNQFKIDQNDLPQAASAGERQVRKQLQDDINLLRTASSGSISHIVGASGDIGELPIGASTESRLSAGILRDKNARPVFAAAKRIQGAMQNAGIAEAKSMGASGINTIGEAKLYFQAMPQLDFSSEEALKQSIKAIQDRTKSWNDEHPDRRGGALSPQNVGSSQGAGDEFATSQGF